MTCTLIFAANGHRSLNQQIVDIVVRHLAYLRHGFAACQARKQKANPVLNKICQIRDLFRFLSQPSL